MKDLILTIAIFAIALIAVILGFVAERYVPRTNKILFNTVEILLFVSLLSVLAISVYTFHETS